MKPIISWDDFLFEFVSFKGKVPTDEQFVFWHNGKISTENDGFSSMQFGLGPMPISAKLDPKDKLVQIFTMDDHSEFRQIRRFQQMLADLVRAKIIDRSWSLRIGTSDKSTAQNLGSANVGAAIDYNAHFNSVIPIAFHGTTTHHLESIRVDGIRPRSVSKADPNWKRFYTGKSSSQVYLTIDVERAAYYAVQAAESTRKAGFDCDPVVVRVSNIPISLVVVDDDFETNLGMLQLMDFLNHGQSTEARAKKNAAIKGIRSSSQFAVKSTIPPSMIAEVIPSSKLSLFD